MNAHTPVCELLGIEHPIVSAPMAADPRLPAAVSSLMLLLQPAASLALAAVILGQTPTLVQVTGAVLTCGGALAASLAATRRSAAAEPAGPG